MLYFNQCPKCGGTVELKYQELECLMCGKVWYKTAGLDQTGFDDAQLDFEFYRRLAEDG